MGHQIIKQDDSEFYCIFSSVTDSIIFYNATEEDLYEYYREQAVYRADEDTKRILDRVQDPEDRRPYSQFTMTFKQACKETKKRTDELYLFE